MVCRRGYEWLSMIEITQTLPSHIEELADNLREADAKEITCFGISIREALAESNRHAQMSKTALVNGVVAGIWGLNGIILGDVGQPWLLTSPICDQYPLQFVLLYRQEVRKMLEMYPRLENIVDNSYTRAVKVLELVGFKLGEPQPMGHTGAMFRSFWKDA